MKPVLCFGEALIDFLNIDTTKADGINSPEFRQYPGGAPANAAVAVAKLGGKSYFAGQVGSDNFGKYLCNALNHYGVDTRFLHFHATAKTALAFVHLDAQGDRSFSFYREQSADVLFERTQVDPSWFGKDAIFHFCSNTLTNPQIARTTAYAVEMARDNQSLVSFDVNLRNNLWPDHKPDIALVNQLVSRAHLVKFSKEEFDYLSGGDSNAYLRQCLRQHCHLLLITDGPSVIRYFGRHFSGMVTPPMVKAVDTTAGGDGFIGGLLCALSQFSSLKKLLGQQQHLQQIIEFAASCGAFTVTQPGAFPALPAKNSPLQNPQSFEQLIANIKEHYPQ